MVKGILQFFLPDKGYGYLLVPDTREEIYVQAKHLQDKIERGDPVIFEIREGKHGLYAVNVRKG